MTAHIVPDAFALHVEDAIALTKPEREPAAVVDIRTGVGALNADELVAWRHRRDTRRSAWRCRR